MSFKRVNTATGHYYTLAGQTQSVRVTKKADLSAEELTAFLSSPAVSSSDADVDFRDDVFVKWTTYTDVASADLPYGTYDYLTGDPFTPNRLVPMQVRQGETYIPVQYANSIKADIARFLASRPAYADLGFLYRRGYLLHGPPGNGKTTFIRELTKEIPDSYTIWLNEFPRRNFCQALNALPGMKIIVIEEITDENNNFHMGALLELLDGESSINNSITIATTNYPENLKQNLADRPGRFDVIFEVGNPPPEHAQSLLDSLLKCESNFQPRDLSFAQIKELALLHRVHGISLPEAYDRLLKHKDAFKNGFTEVKKFGF